MQTTFKHTFIVWIIATIVWIGYIYVSISTPIWKTQILDITQKSSIGARYYSIEKWVTGTNFRWMSSDVYQAFERKYYEYAIVRLHGMSFQNNTAYVFGMTYADNLKLNIQGTDVGIRTYHVLFVSNESQWWQSDNQLRFSVVSADDHTLEVNGRTLFIAISDIQVLLVKSWFPVYVIETIMWVIIGLLLIWLIQLRLSLLHLSLIFGIVLVFHIWFSQSFVSYGTRIVVWSFVILLIVGEYKHSKVLLGNYQPQTYNMTDKYVLSLDNLRNNIYDFLHPRVDTTVHTQIEWFVYVMTALVGFVTMLLAVVRTDMSEVWDRVIYLGAAITAGMIWMVFNVKKIKGDIASEKSMEYTKKRFLYWSVLGITLIFWSLTFQVEKQMINLEYNGFGGYVLVLSLIIAPFVHRLLLGNIHRFTQLFIQLLALLLVIGSYIATFQIINIGSIIHNMYVINEMFVPATNLIPYYSFIPQYSILNGAVVYLLKYFGYINNAELSFNLAVVMLQIFVLVVIGLIVRMNYKNMSVPRWSTAVIFSIPPVMFATHTWWQVLFQNSTESYFVMHMFSYSLMSIRELVIFVVGSVGIGVLSKIQLRKYFISQVATVYGLSIIATIGLYHNSDFGTFAAIALGATLVFCLFIANIHKLILVVVYVLGLLINYGFILQIFEVHGTLVNWNYLFWFQRQFSSGYGAKPIIFPGNGLFLIITAVVVSFTGMWIYTLLRNQSQLLRDNTKLLHQYLSVLYFGIVTVLVLTYYVNRSYMSFQGSSAYITLFVAVFALFNLGLYIQGTNRLFTSLNYYNYTLRFLVALPVSIALTHVYIPMNFYNETPSQAIMKPFRTEHAQLEMAYEKISNANISVGYAGDFANIMNLYFHIPAVNPFNAVDDTKISGSAVKVFCQQLSISGYDVLLLNRPPEQWWFTCDGFETVSFDYIRFDVMVRNGFRERLPEKADTLDEIMAMCRLDINNKGRCD